MGSYRGFAVKISIVIPVYNGAKTIPSLVELLEKELAPHFELEMVLINDGSPSDNSAEVCTRIALSNPKVKFLDLSSNFSEHNAVMAGLNYCSGEAAVIIDDDFQNPPSEIVKLVDKLNEGYDVAYSYYMKKEHHFLRNLGSRFNNIVATVLLGKTEESLPFFVQGRQQIRHRRVGEIQRPLPLHRRSDSAVHAKLREGAGRASPESQGHIRIHVAQVDLLVAANVYKFFDSAPAYGNCSRICVCRGGIRGGHFLHD